MPLMACVCRVVVVVAMLAMPVVGHASAAMLEELYPVHSFGLAIGHDVQREPASAYVVPVSNAQQWYKASVGYGLESVGHYIYGSGKGGYRSLRAPYDDLGRGIDGLYVRGEGERLKVIVSEAKFGTSDINKKTGQMSLRWIEDRFDKALEFKKSEIERLQEKELKNGRLASRERARLQQLESEYEALSKDRSIIIEKIRSGDIHREVVKGDIVNGRLEVRMVGVAEADGKAGTGSLKGSSGVKKSTLYFESGGGSRVLKYAGLDKPGVAISGSDYQKDYRRLYREKKRLESLGMEKEAKKLDHQLKHMSNLRKTFIRDTASAYGESVKKHALKSGLSEAQAEKLAVKYKKEVRRLLAGEGVENSKALQLAMSRIDIDVKMEKYNVHGDLDSIRGRASVHIRLKIAGAREMIRNFAADARRSGVRKAISERAGSIKRSSMRSLKSGFRRSLSEFRKGARYYSKRVTWKGRRTAVRMMSKAAGGAFMHALLVVAVLHEIYEVASFVSQSHTTYEKYRFWSQKIGGLVGVASGVLCSVVVGVTEGLGTPLCYVIGGVLAGLGGMAGGVAGDILYAHLHQMDDKQRRDFAQWMIEHYREAAS